MKVKQTDDKWYLVGNDEGDEIVQGSENALMHGEGGKWTSRSWGFETKEELIEKSKILPEPCRETGCPVSAVYGGDIGKVMVEQNLCFMAAFWWQLAQRAHQASSIRIDGEHYQIGPKTTGNDRWNGYGGSEFTIKIKATGEVIKTNNLWHQGKIIEKFKTRLPDNAEFVK